MKPRAYEVIPWKAIVPAQPVVDCTRLDWDQILRAQTVVITGTATDFFTTEAAQREAARMLRACQDRLRRGERYALIELLDDNPAFILVALVREALLRWLELGVPLRRRGRIRGAHLVEPLIIGALADGLVAQGEVPNLEQAFHYLADKGLASYHTLKALYYQRRHDSRYRPLYFEFPERRFEVSVEVAERYLARVRMLEAGDRVSYRGQDAAHGRIETTFVAQ
jgi:hypothetical protein